MSGLNRRRFLQLIGTSTAAAGLNACVERTPREIVPYVRSPEEIVPGKPLFYASTLTLSGVGLGVLVESHLGRPTKVEGNPDHPASLGATDIFSQAAVRTLYDPERSRFVSYLGEPATWDDFATALRPVLDGVRGRNGAGLGILTGTVTSPTFGGQMQRLLQRYPEAQWYRWEPAGRQDNAYAGTRLLFGRTLDAVYQPEAANVILSLDSDLLDCRPETLRYVRGFADRRRVREDAARMNRLYAVEASFTLTGAAADHRLALRASAIPALTRALAARLGVPGVEAANPPPGLPAGWLDAVARDLQDNTGRCLVVPGHTQPPEVHALAHAINAHLGGLGRTVSFIEPIAVDPVDQTASLRSLVNNIAAGQVEALVILDSNPAYTAPADLPFADVLPRVPLSVAAGLYRDETSALCHWHLPLAHELEAWGDARAFDGTASIIQPLIEPLYRGQSVHEIVSFLSDGMPRPGYEIVREYWQGQNLPGDFEATWREILRTGIVPNSAFAPVNAGPAANWAAALPAAETPVTGQPVSADTLEVVFRTDPTIYDGRFANNIWLQELPKPITSLTWDAAAFLSPATAARLGVGSESVVEVTLRGRTLRAPVWIQPDHADGAVTLHLGYGRDEAVEFATGASYNAYRLRFSDAPWVADGAVVAATGERYPLAATQGHHQMEDRHLVRNAPLATFRRNPDFAHEVVELSVPIRGLYPEYSYLGYAWGMAIDQTVCTGCNACVIACQAENNVPSVGKDQVLIGRDMHWLRVDAYYAEDTGGPPVLFQPVPCMHCEKAPCEYVCPVAATVHSEQGLNDMVYNRCVGTRYCSQNCPYKVRRFNYFDYADFDPPAVLKMLPNPDVTVRSRGVMEKCTYCVQRIRAAEVAAETANQSIGGDDILTACQAACPTGAITFGNINDSNASVARWKASPLNYGLLDHLNTQPRTTYLAAVWNPNPALRPEVGDG